MNAFEVSVNRELVCTVGVENDGVLMAGLRWVIRSADTNGIAADVTALDRHSAEHLIWRMPKIALGDEITIRPVQADQIDQPAEHISVEKSRL